MRFLFTTVLFLLTIPCFPQGKKANKTIQHKVFAPGDVIKLPTVQFDFDGGRLGNNDSLDLIANFISRHPELVFEYASHTDSRGSAESNQQLSQSRAQFCVDYIVLEKKIDPARIIPKGYGESQLLISDEEINKAGNKKEKELLHQQNRRMELVVIRMGK